MNVQNPLKSQTLQAKVGETDTIYIEIDHIIIKPKVKHLISDTR